MRSEFPWIMVETFPDFDMVGPEVSYLATLEEAEAHQRSYDREVTVSLDWETVKVALELLGHSEEDFTKAVEHARSLSLEQNRIERSKLAP